MDNMLIEEEWLSQILGNSTKHGYSRGITYFKEFTKIDSVEELINLRKKERNFETIIIQFYQWLQKEKGVTANSARAYIISLQSLFSYAGFPLKLKTKLPKTHMKLELWIPTLEDVQKIYKLGDISVKAWISLSRDVPARIGDLLKITSDQISSGEFLFQSTKENVVGKCYVSEDTKTLFRQLKTAGLTLPTTQRGIDKMMENACKIAGLERRINQHLFRKLWISMAINLGLNDTIIKILAFKSVPQETLTYFLNREDLRESWQKIVNALPLENASNGRVADLQKESEELKTVMRILAKYVVEAMKHEDSRRRKYKSSIRIPDLRALEDFLGTNNDRKKEEVLLPGMWRGNHLRTMDRQR